eukprot:Lithocolla_globosa_v1_NODE_10759_length_568_cov_12.480545.p2 type:complete len:104 gc:universal NODE_10759_length_568_cov_12.480545:95-406(+)
MHVIEVRFLRPTGGEARRATWERSIARRGGESLKILEHYRTYVGLGGARRAPATVRIDRDSRGLSRESDRPGRQPGSRDGPRTLPMREPRAAAFRGGREFLRV